jgi:Chromo (CHRromatin Organisation MOdifier) domain
MPFLDKFGGFFPDPTPDPNPERPNSFKNSGERLSQVVPEDNVADFSLASSALKQLCKDNDNEIPSDTDLKIISETRTRTSLEDNRRFVEEYLFQMSRKKSTKTKLQQLKNNQSLDRIARLLTAAIGPFKKKQRVITKHNISKLLKPVAVQVFRQDLLGHLEAVLNSFTVVQQYYNITDEQLHVVENTSDDVSDESDDESDTEDLFLVESILAKRVNPSTHEEEFLIKWQGYSSLENTWEPRSSLR